MPWIIGGGIIYIVLLVTLGVLTIRKGHWVMFLLGFVFPVFWLIGGVMPPRLHASPRRRGARRTHPFFVREKSTRPRAYVLAFNTAWTMTGATTLRAPRSSKLTRGPRPLLRRRRRRWRPRRPRLVTTLSDRRVRLERSDRRQHVPESEQQRRSNRCGRPRPPLREEGNQAAPKQQLLGQRGADRDAHGELVARGRATRHSRARRRRRRAFAAAPPPRRRHSGPLWTREHRREHLRPGPPFATRGPPWSLLQTSRARQRRRRQPGSRRCATRRAAPGARYALAESVSAIAASSRVSRSGPSRRFIATCQHVHRLRERASPEEHAFGGTRKHGRYTREPCSASAARRHDQAPRRSPARLRRIRPGPWQTHPVVPRDTGRPAPDPCRGSPRCGAQRRAAHRARTAGRGDVDPAPVPVAARLGRRRGGGREPPRARTLRAHRALGRRSVRAGLRVPNARARRRRSRLGGVAPTCGDELVPGGLMRFASRFAPLLSAFAGPIARQLVAHRPRLRPFGSQVFDLYMRTSPEGDRRVFADPEMKEMFLDDLFLASEHQLPRAGVRPRALHEALGFLDPRHTSSHPLLAW